MKYKNRGIEMTTEQKALERLNWHIHANRFGKETLEALILAREALQKQPRWIPVTERLPESPE